MSRLPVRLGVFGGAFDPPHVAHRALIEAALVQLQLDQLRVVPTGQAWHKPRLLSDAEHRIAMAKLAFADLRGVSVDTRETTRAGPTYTVDTLRELQAENPAAELFLLIGEDQARALQSWHEWQVVVRLAIICVAQREDSTAIAGHFSLPMGFQKRFLSLNFPASAASATRIRALAAAGQRVVPLVCAGVARYIAHHHLYQTA